MKTFSALTVATLFAFGVVPALAAVTAAQLSTSAGTVTVNGAPPVTGPLKPGDVIRTNKASSAVLVFADGCRISVAPSSTVTVGTISPCAAGTAGAGGAAGVAAAAGAGAVLGTSTVVIGTVAVLGAAAGVLAIAGQSPSSP